MTSAFATPWQILTNAAANGALNVCACGDINGQEQPSGSNMPLSDFQMAEEPRDFLTCAGGRLILCARRLASEREARFDLAPSAMKPAPFRYIAAPSLPHAHALKEEHGDEAKFLAG